MDCLRADPVMCPDELEEVIEIYLRILRDRCCSSLMEEIVDTLAYFDTGPEALGVYVELCTLTDWAKAGWPDLRKAVDNIYGMFLAGECSRDELISAMHSIIDCEVNSDDPRSIRLHAADLLEFVENADRRKS